MKYHIGVVLILTFIYGVLLAPEGGIESYEKVGRLFPTRATLFPHTKIFTRPTLPTISPDVTFCQIADRLATLLKRLGVIDIDRPYENATISANVTEDIYLSFKIGSISCWGLSTLDLQNCTAFNDSFTHMEIHLDKFNMQLTNYELEGIAGVLPLEGKGNGSIQMEDFTITLDGMYEENKKGILQFTSLITDLFLYQWTVNLENLMPGTDIGILANEVLSEEGREVMNAIEDLLNYNDAFMNFINDIILEFP